MAALAALRDDATRTADHGELPGEAVVPVPELDDEAILGVLCDLFARRTQVAFGERLDWWIETLQCDLAPQAAAGVALTAISKWPFDQRAGAAGVEALRTELVSRARMLLARPAHDGSL